MYIIVQHDISDPKNFWETAEASMPNLPASLTLHQVFPNDDGTRAVCLWEADAVGTVREYLEESVGQVSQNQYFAVESTNAVGLPEASKI